MIRLGALCWLLTAEFFVAQAIAQAGFPGYSLTGMDISVLGISQCLTTPDALCSPLHWVFNAGIILNGLLVAAGLWLTRNLWPSGRLRTTALSLLAIGGGLGSVLVGLFPLDTVLAMHMLGAILALGLAGLGMVAMGVLVWQRSTMFALYTLATGFITLLAFVCYALELWGGFGRGTLERLAAWPHTLWYMTAGALILAGVLSPASAKPASGASHH